MSGLEAAAGRGDVASELLALLKTKTFEPRSTPVFNAFWARKLTEGDNAAVEAIAKSFIDAEADEEQLSYYASDVAFMRVLIKGMAVHVAATPYPEDDYFEIEHAPVWYVYDKATRAIPREHETELMTYVFELLLEAKYDTNIYYVFGRRYYKTVGVDLDVVRRIYDPATSAEIRELFEDLFNWSAIFTAAVFNGVPAAVAAQVGAKAFDVAKSFENAKEYAAWDSDDVPIDVIEATAKLRVPPALMARVRAWAATAISYSERMKYFKFEQKYLADDLEWRRSPQFRAILHATFNAGNFITIMTSDPTGEDLGRDAAAIMVRNPLLTDQERFEMAVIAARLPNPFWVDLFADSFGVRREHMIATPSNPRPRTGGDLLRAVITDMETRVQYDTPWRAYEESEMRARIEHERMRERVARFLQSRGGRPRPLKRKM